MITQYLLWKFFHILIAILALGTSAGLGIVLEFYGGHPTHGPFLLRAIGPVSIYTVARELGHGSDEMVKRIYAHLGDVRHRAEVVEYRVEQHLEQLGDRLQRLGLTGPFVTGNVTADGTIADAKNPDSTEVLPGQKLPESGRPDSNRRRPAWEAGILPLNYAREARLTREVNVPGPLTGVKRAPSTPPESSEDPAR